MAKEETMCMPRIGERWKHHNGHVYSIIMIANPPPNLTTYPVTIIYVGDSGRIYAKPLHNFLFTMTLESEAGS